jgi:phospholipid transport system substrate-binding protein
VTGEQQAAAGVMVRSQIAKANGDPINVAYMMRRNGDSWLISDIYLDGAISEAATRRSEFAAAKASSRSFKAVLTLCTELRPASPIYA